MKKLRIAIFEPSRIFPGGGQKVLANVASYLSTKHEVTLFTQRPPEKNLDFNKAKIKLIAPHNRLLAPLAFLWNKISKKEYDLIIAGGFPATLTTIRNSIPSIHVCNSPPRVFYDLKTHMLQNANLKEKIFIYVKNIFFKKLDYFAAQKDTKILSISEEVQRRVKKYYRRNSYVFYAGVDPTKFKSGEYKNYILSVCRIVSAKRIEMMVKSMKYVQNKKIKLIIVGTGNLKNKIKKLSAKYSNVELKGFVSEDKLKELYSNCLAVIYIPINEDYGYIPVEAAICEKATIGVNEGGLKETIVDDKTGFLIKNISPQKIAEKIDLLANDKKLAKKMGKQAKEYSKKFHLKNTFPILEKTIQEVVKCF